MYNLDKLKPIVTDDLIRLGRNVDGGYVINKRIVQKSQVLISFGIHTDWTFEEDFYTLKKGHPFLLQAFDFSVGPGYYINTAFKMFRQMVQGKEIIKYFKYGLYFIKIELNFNIFFHKKGIKFYKLGIDTSNHYPFTTFEQLFQNIKETLPEDSVFIKMDIEGYEFKVIPDMLHFDGRISGFVVEFHDLDINSDLFEELLQQIYNKGFVITHIHPNNWGGVIENTKLPRLLEITFAKRIFFTSNELSAVNRFKYPRSGLDFPCMKDIAELDLHFT